MVENKIVSAVGVASVSLSKGGQRLSSMIEKAMSKSVLESMRKGISEPSKIKANMMAARQRVLDEHRKPQTEE